MPQHERKWLHAAVWRTVLNGLTAIRLRSQVGLLEGLIQINQ